MVGERATICADLGYQYMFGSDRQVGTSSFVGGDFDNSTTSASAHWLLREARSRLQRLSHQAVSGKRSLLVRWGSRLGI